MYMNTMRHYINIIEGRSNPELNIKPTTANVFDVYLKKYGSNGIYVHFNKIEKVGIKYGSNNTFGPMGIYAMPIHMATDYGLRNAAMMKAQYANIILAKPGISILNLDTVDISTMQGLALDALKFHKKKAASKEIDYKSTIVPNDIKGCWQSIQNLLYNISRRRGKKLPLLLTVFFRKVGFDAIIDNNQIINDNPGQIVFITPGSYDVVETIPLRF
jgi:hypothetical protein